jgi:7-cyano-7-deazaguanine synthase in queuosine biosynthesis
MTEPLWIRMIEEMRQKYQIPEDRFYGLDGDSMSRAIVASRGIGGLDGTPAAYNPLQSPESSRQRLQEAFGEKAGVERIQVQIDFVLATVSQSIPVDWMLPAPQFVQVVEGGLEEHFPDLSVDARNVILGSYTYSHAK